MKKIITTSLPFFINGFHFDNFSYGLNDIQAVIPKLKVKNNELYLNGAKMNIEDFHNSLYSETLETLNFFNEDVLKKIIRRKYEMSPAIKQIYNGEELCGYILEVVVSFKHSSHFTKEWRKLTAEKARNYMECRRLR